MGAVTTEWKWRRVRVGSYRRQLWDISAGIWLGPERTWTIKLEGEAWQVRNERGDLMGAFGALDDAKGFVGRR